MAIVVFSAVYTQLGPEKHTEMQCIQTHNKLRNIAGLVLKVWSHGGMNKASGNYTPTVIESRGPGIERMSSAQ